MSAIRITSEIGELKKVLVHEPGPEVLAVTPGKRHDFLYDDIIELDTARSEHRTMVAVLERFSQVYEVRDLLRDVVDKPEAREMLRERTAHVAPSGFLAKRLEETPADELVALLVEGTEEEVGPIAKMLNEGGYALPPLPNLFFMRDVGMVIGEWAVIGSMRHGARWSEEMLLKTMFQYHPEMAGKGIIYDGSGERRLDYTLEGGDVHPVREDLLILGLSERSSALGIDHLCDTVFDQSDVTDVIVVVMPAEPTAIHLDMLFTQIDEDLCLVSPHQFIGPERLAVLHRQKGKDRVREMPDFFAALRSVEFPLEPILCGGEERGVQEREQWASGCNLLALKPGVAIAYRRNEATLEELKKAGFRVVESEQFLLGEEDVAEGDRVILTIKGSELVRGGGGPRCMTLPLFRESV
ncbi:MAG: arginine deiminase family protein [Gemmatimonadota bacterium]|nr:arginine deiminase family protein [Gemmatimonadota bacterium]